MVDSRISNPGARFNAICLSFSLESAGYQISLVTNATESIAQTAETQCVNGSIVCLKIVDPSDHRFAGLNEFVGYSYSLKSSLKCRLLFSLNKARQESEFLILITSREFCRSDSRINYFLA